MIFTFCQKILGEVPVEAFAAFVVTWTLNIVRMQKELRSNVAKGA